MEKDRNYILDSIRLPAEVKELKKLNGFFLVYITASKEIRFERMNARGRIGDPTTFEEFLRIEKIERLQKELDEKLQVKKDFDKIVLVSGDGDYKMLVDFLIEENKFERMLFPSKTNSSSLYQELGSEYFDYLENKDVKDKIEYKKKRAP